MYVAQYQTQPLTYMWGPSKVNVDTVTWYPNSLLQTRDIRLCVWPHINLKWKRRLKHKLTMPFNNGLSINHKNQNFIKLIVMRLIIHPPWYFFYFSHSEIIYLMHVLIRIVRIFNQIRNICSYLIGYVFISLRQIENVKFCEKNCPVPHFKLTT